MDTIWKANPLGGNPNSYWVDPEVGTLVELDDCKSPMITRSPKDTKSETQSNNVLSYESNALKELHRTLV